jgi:hypothetical protein
LKGLVFRRVEKGRHEFTAKVYLLVDLEGFATGQPRNDTGVSLVRFLKEFVELPRELHALTIISLM